MSIKYFKLSDNVQTYNDCDDLTIYKFKNKIRILSFKDKELKKHFVAMKNLYSVPFSIEGSILAHKLANGDQNEHT